MPNIQPSRRLNPRIIIHKNRRNTQSIKPTNTRNIIRTTNLLTPTEIPTQRRPSRGNTPGASPRSYHLKSVDLEIVSFDEYCERYARAPTRAQRLGSSSEVDFAGLETTIGKCAVGPGTAVCVLED